MKMFGMFRSADSEDQFDGDDSPRYSNDTTPEKAICSDCFEANPSWHSLDLFDCTGYHGLQCDLCNVSISVEEQNEHREEVMRLIPGDVEGQSNNNAERCIYITKAIKASYEARFEDVFTTMSDMLADMMHLCVLTGVDIDQVISGAKANFLAEFRNGGMARFHIGTKKEPLSIEAPDPPTITHTQIEEIEPTIV